MKSQPIGSYHYFACIFVITIVAATLINYSNAGDRLVCNTKNETCQVQTGSLREVIAVLNFTFNYAGADNVTYIRFEDSEVGEVPQVLVKKFPNVRVLDLKFSRLKRFRKPLLENAKELIELDLSYNKLKRLEPDCFKGAERLQVLNIFRNDISEVHELAFRGLGYLDRLVLSSNEIRRLKPGVLAPLANLTELDLKKNRLETVGLQLQALHNLEVIDLSYNKIRKLEVATFKGLSNLHIADLSFNRLDEIQRNALLDKPHLFAINFADNKLTGVEFVVPKNLGIIDFSRNKIENLTLEAEEVTANSSLIRSRVSIKAPFNLVKYIACGILINKLNLTYNNLTDLNFIHQDLSVLTLDASNNPLILTSNSTRELPKDLKELAVRNISSENPDNVKILLKRLPTMAPGLEELDLSDNDLSEMDWNEYSPLEKIKRLALFNTEVGEIESLQKVFPNLDYIRLSIDNEGFNCTDVERVYQASSVACRFD